MSYSYLCFLILLCLSLLVGGCSNKDYLVINSKLSYYTACMNKVWEYEKKCDCILYPKGYHNYKYCDEWTKLKMQGYSIALDIPE